MECLQPQLTEFITLMFLFMCSIMICGYGTYKMYQKIKAKNDSFMVARHPLLSFSSVILNCIDLMLIQPIYCILFVSSNIFTTQSMYWSVNVLSDIRFILFGFVFVARIWLLHYDYRFGKECVSLLWKRKSKKQENDDNNNGSIRTGIICSKFFDNFYLQHRQTFGNPKRVIIVTLIVTCICLTILDIIPFISKLNQITYLELNDYIRIPIYFFLGLLLIILFTKVKSIDDKFKIRLEIVCILCIPGLLAFIYMTCEIIITLPSIREQNILSDCIFFYLYAYFMLFIVSFTLLIETILPLKLDKNQSQSVQHTINLMKHGQSGKDVSFGDILGSAQGLLLFVEHLETEFSVENILFIVFIAKYREHYMRKIIPTLLSDHQSIIQTKRNQNRNNLTLNSDADDCEYSTTREISGFKAIINITPKATPRKIFKFEKKRFEEDHKTDHNHNHNHNHNHLVDEISPPPDTPEPPYNRDCNRAKTAPSPITPNPNSNSIQKRHFKNCSVLDIPPSPHSVTSAKSISPSSAPADDGMDSSDDDDELLTINIIHSNHNNHNHNNNIVNNKSTGDEDDGEIFNRMEMEKQKQKQKKKHIHKHKHKQKQLQNTNRVKRTLSDASVSGSCLKTPVPGSFKHSPMILEEKQIELLYDIDPEMDVLSLEEMESSNTYDDKMDNDESAHVDDVKDEIEDYEQDDEDGNDHNHDHDHDAGLLQMDEFEFKDDDDEDDEVGMEYLSYNNVKSNTPAHFKNTTSGDLRVIISAEIETEYVETDISHLREPESPSTSDDATVS